MKRLALLLCLFAAPASAQVIVLPNGCGSASYTTGAQSPTQTTGGYGCMGTAPAAQTPLAPSQEALGVTSATALTVPAGATTAVVTVEGATVRWRDDGTAPTASSGSLLAVGSVTTFYGASMKAVKFIQTVGTATLDVAFYK